MKIGRILVTCTGILLFSAFVARADDLFQLYWRGAYYTTNSTGHIIAVSFTEQDFVNQVAQANNLDPSTLVFVYRPNRHDTVVVKAATGAFVADVIQMELNFTDVINPSGSVIVRHAILNDEAHQAPLGSFFGLELRTLSSSGALMNDSLVGTVIYSKPELNTVYGAHVSTGPRVVDLTNTPP